MLIFQDIINFVIFHHHHMSYITGQKSKNYIYLYTLMNKHKYIQINNTEKKDKTTIQMDTTDGRMVGQISTKSKILCQIKTLITKATTNNNKSTSFTK